MKGRGLACLVDARPCRGSRGLGPGIGTLHGQNLLLEDRLESVSVRLELWALFP